MTDRLADAERLRAAASRHLAFWAEKCLEGDKGYREPLSEALCAYKQAEEALASVPVLRG
jgi:hypothetical protein